MANIADIVVFDGATTPVSHTLKPIDVSREKNKVIARWREQLASLPTEAQVRATETSEILPSGVTRVDLKVVVPVMESISGQNAAGYTAAPKVAYEDTFILTSFQHSRSTIAGRRLARQMLVNIAGNVSTSVAAALTGPVADAFDNQAMPT